MNSGIATNMDIVKELLRTLSTEDKESVAKMLMSDVRKTESTDKFLETTINNSTCPHCKSNKVIKKGKINNKQKFFCKECNRYYSIQTKTLFDRTHKEIDTWFSYISMMFEGKTLKQTAEALKINIKTAFYWRHKVLAILSKTKEEALKGIVEADETYFRVSNKGSRKIEGRNTRKRGKCFPWYTEDKRLRGLSHQQVCVLTALDRGKRIFNQPVGLGKMRKDYLDVLQSKLSKNATIITDGDKSYKSLKNVKIKQIAGGIIKDKVYNLARINAYHSGLKQWIDRFNGVSTKYLDNYVNFFKLVKSKVNAFEQVIEQSGICRVSDIQNKGLCFTI